MNKFTALLRKDIQISKNQLMIPLWIVAGFYLVILLISAISYFTGSFNLNLGNIQGSPSSDFLNYILNMALMGLPGMISLIFIIILTQSALNENIRNHSELFHRSQPVSIWYQSASKYLVGIAGNWVILSLIALFNFIVFAFIIASVDRFVISMAFLGTIQSLISFMKIGLIVGSLSFFVSAVFKDKAFLQGLAIIVGIQFLLIIINVIMQWHLPLPLSYLIKLINNSTPVGMKTILTNESLNIFIKETWMRILFNWKTLIQIAVSGLLFVVATIIYKNREIK
ncbi:MAG: hypothetical protein K9N07_08045 [Candidatus Cloacimonetes bacterium]|nr:hypothetical protein [Candidatus Cloacimonadota bacterium]